MSTNTRFAKTTPLAMLRLLLLASVSVAAPATAWTGENSPGSKATKNESTEQDSPETKNSEKSEDAETKTIELDGVFVSAKTSELSTQADQIGSLTIKKIKPHGARVKAGQNVIWFEKKEPDDKVDAAQIELKLAKLGLAEAEFQFEQFQQQQQLDRQAADRAKQAAQQKYDNFMRIDRERQIESAQFSRKQSEQSLANAREELEQLQQMYEEDDLTEESEEIVLERAKHAVEAAEFRLAGVEIQSDRTIEQTVPRETKQQEEQLKRAELAHEEAIAKLQRDRRRRQLELKKERDKVADLEEKFEELRQQRGALVMTAPHDGFVIHGALKRGRVSEKPPQIKPQTDVAPNQVVATIVDPSELKVQVDVPEDKLAHIQTGISVTVTPSVAQDRSIKGKVRQVDSIPFAGTKFEAMIAIDLEQDDLIRPTMTCKVEIDTDTNDQSEDSQQPAGDEKQKEKMSNRSKATPEASRF